MVVVENCKHMVVEEICMLLLVKEHNMEEVVGRHIHAGVVEICNEL